MPGDTSKGGAVAVAAAAAVADCDDNYDEDAEDGPTDEGTEDEEVEDDTWLDEMEDDAEDDEESNASGEHVVSVSAAPAAPRGPQDRRGEPTGDLRI